MLRIWRDVEKQLLHVTVLQRGRMKAGVQAQQPETGPQSLSKHRTTAVLRTTHNLDESLRRHGVHVNDKYVTMPCEVVRGHETCRRVVVFEHPRRRRRRRRRPRRSSWTWSQSGGMLQPYRCLLRVVKIGLDSGGSVRRLHGSGSVCCTALDLIVSRLSLILTWSHHLSIETERPSLLFPVVTHMFAAICHRSYFGIPQ